MKETPILFKGEMVKAILDGRKTQTRRICKGTRKHFCDLNAMGNAVFTDDEITYKEVTNRFGDLGDKLWVKETWGCPDADHSRVKDGRKPQQGDRLVYAANDADAWQWRGGPGCADFCWRPSIFMPRWASRISLEIVGLRVEHLQDITEEDAKAEGVRQEEGGYWNYIAGEPFNGMTARQSFFSLWESINGFDSLDADPYVWVIEFKRLRP